MFSSNFQSSIPIPSQLNPVRVPFHRCWSNDDFSRLPPAPLQPLNSMANAKRLSDSFPVPHSSICFCRCWSTAGVCAPPRHGSIVPCFPVSLHVDGRQPCRRCLITRAQVEDLAHSISSNHVAWRRRCPGVPLVVRVTGFACLGSIVLLLRVWSTTMVTKGDLAGWVVGGDWICVGLIGCGMRWSGGLIYRPGLELIHRPRLEMNRLDVDWRVI